jgi:hypothetical protein
MASVLTPIYTTTKEASKAASINSTSFPKALPISLSF